MEVATQELTQPVTQAYAKADAKADAEVTQVETVADPQVGKATTLVIYHASCPDGFMAAWLFHRWLGDTAEYVPFEYGEEPPSVKGLEVYVLDFSFPREVMIRMAKEAKSLVVLDHHKTAQEACEGLDFCTFMMDHSGAGLALEWLSSHTAFVFSKTIRQFVAFVEDNDLWRKSLDNTDEVRAAYLSIPFKFGDWSDLIIRGRDYWVSTGKAILAYQRKMVDDHMRKAELLSDTALGVDHVPFVNSSAKDIVSMLLHKMCEHFPFAAAYWWQDGWWNWSLRSSGGVDVSEVAKMFGGGGHKTAAGFKTRTLEEVLKTGR